MGIEAETLGGLLTASLLLLQMARVDGHGRLMDPPARNSMWRLGFNNPVNYNDNELFCGGYAVQWGQNNGRCGVCGDPYSANSPRLHETGGTYANGIIGRTYTTGQDIDIEVDLTANHFGRFEIFLCPNNNPLDEATQECFDRYPLYVSGTMDVKYTILRTSKHAGTFKYKVSLPSSLTCSQCVLQWTYYTGNLWGVCDNSSNANKNCGRTETFRNCADISISSSGPSQHTGLAERVLPLVVRSQVCTDRNKTLPEMDEWCQTNCLRYPPNCPPERCYCPDQCDALGELANKKGADVFCQDQCIVYPSRCPASQCRCY